MSVVGLGTDIVEIDRLEKVLQRTGKAFAERVLSADEMLAFDAQKKPERFLAKRFAAKEAAAKALGTGIAQGVSFHDLVIEHDELGKPLLRLTGKALTIAEQLGAITWHISISDEKHYATATVILSS